MPNCVEWNGPVRPPEVKLLSQNGGSRFRRAAQTSCACWLEPTVEEVWQTAIIPKHGTFLVFILRIAAKACESIIPQFSSSYSFFACGNQFARICSPVPACITLDSMLQWWNICFLLSGCFALATPSSASSWSPSCNGSISFHWVISPHIYHLLIQLSVYKNWGHQSPAGL